MKAINLKQFIKEEVNKLQRITMLEEEKNKIEKKLSILNERFGLLLNKSFNKGEIIKTNNIDLNNVLENLRKDLEQFGLFISNVHGDDDSNLREFVVYLKDAEAASGMDFYKKYSIGHKDLMEVLLRHGGKHITFESGVISMTINI